MNGRTENHSTKTPRKVLLIYIYDFSPPPKEDKDVKIKQGGGAGRQEKIV